MISIILYAPEKKYEWDDFVRQSKNSHFMFYRDYIDYHSYRFVDNSLMFYDGKKSLIAVLPANVKDGILYSHQGLTFGGLLLNKKATTEMVYNLFCCTIEFLKEKTDFNSIVYKRMPDFYNSYPSQEDLYSLFLLDAKLFRRDVTVAIDMAAPYNYQEMRKRKVKKAQKSGIEVFEESSFAAYWILLSKVLNVNHNAKPVHSLDEIELLHSKFPNNIKCFTACLNGEPLAGTVIFETEKVVHTQYLANSEFGRELGALDFVINHLLKNVYKDKKYFDFGISTENNGLVLNRGLIAQKEGFGARAFVHDFYEIKIA